MKLKSLNTFVYIDSSNINNALKTFNRKINWELFYDYLKDTYPKLKFIKYYEGIDKTDKSKYSEFQKLETKGFTLRTLERKTYSNQPKYKSFKCRKCKTKNRVEILKQSKVLKSNIDVYLCTDLICDVLNNKNPFHVIIISCDGDYAEMIKAIIDNNENSHISVFATPYLKNNNYLSVRLKQLEQIDRYYLVNIMNIKDRISTLELKKNESYT